MLTGQPAAVADTDKSKPLPRQKLSCTKCRERKVKCDRTKPCSACCIRGAPKDCHFAAEAGDFEPIQQSYEIRKLRAENIQLKKRLQEYEGLARAQNNESASTPDSPFHDSVPSLPSHIGDNKRPFLDTHGPESIYFGTPSFTSVIQQLESINNNAPASLTHTLPRDQEVFAPTNTQAKEADSSYPFPTLFSATPERSIPELFWNCLPAQEVRQQYFEAFELRVNASSFPQVPIELDKDEVERFLAGGPKKAEHHPDMFALIFATLALGSQHTSYNKSCRKLEASVPATERPPSSIYIAAAMQALRLASFMHAPSVLVVQTLVLIGPFLINSGRFLDASNLFGTTIRLAQSIGLHRHPQFLGSILRKSKDHSMRQALWWWMLHMDEQYSMTLGRPLGISSIGDCPWPLQLSTDPIAVRFSEVVNRFTVLARQVLGPRQLTTVKIDQYTREFRSLFASLPETLQFHHTWRDGATPLPAWPFRSAAPAFYCKLQSYLILLNRQRDESPAPLFESHLQPGASEPFRPINQAPAPFLKDSTVPNFGRECVISSSEGILDCMLYLWLRVREALHDWMIAQQAFNACTILLLDAMEKKSHTAGSDKVQQAFVIFQKMEKNEVHALAGLAVAKISAGVRELEKVIESVSAGQEEAEQNQQTHIIHEPHHKEALRGAQHDSTVITKTGAFLLETQFTSTGPWSPLHFREKADPTGADALGNRNLGTEDLSSQSPMPYSSATSTSAGIYQASLSDGNQRKRRSTQLTPSDIPSGEPEFDSSSKSSSSIMHDRIMRTAIPILGRRVERQTHSPLVGPKGSPTMVTSKQKEKWPAIPVSYTGLFTTFPRSADNISMHEAASHLSIPDQRSPPVTFPVFPMRIKRPVAKRRRVNRDSSTVASEAQETSLPGDEAVDMTGELAPSHQYRYQE